MHHGEPPARRTEAPGPAPGVASWGAPAPGASWGAPAPGASWGAPAPGASWGAPAPALPTLSTHILLQSCDSVGPGAAPPAYDAGAGGGGAGWARGARVVRGLGAAGGGARLLRRGQDGQAVGQGGQPVGVQDRPHRGPHQVHATLLCTSAPLLLSTSSPLRQDSAMGVLVPLRQIPRQRQLRRHGGRGMVHRRTPWQTDSS